MKLVTFNVGDRVAIGKIIGDEVIDLHASDPTLPQTMKSLLQGGAELMDRANSLVDGVSIGKISDVKLMAPVPHPSKFLAIGMNYAKHVNEAIALGFNMPPAQVWFNKQVSCVNGPYDPIYMPRVSDQLDYEIELGVVIGERCRYVKAADARSVIAGYLVCNDVSIRDWQMRSPTMTMGKSFDSHGPIGPWLVTDDEIENPHALKMRLLVNGEVRQEDSTSDMVANIFEQIEHLSTAFTLEPGDLIATGTPSGVAVAMKPQRFLKVGDVVRAEIEKLGFLENTVTAEPA